MNAGQKTLQRRQAAAPAQSDTTRQTLLNAAAELFITQGYTATTVKQITANAAISGSFYSHFTSKSDIGHAVADTWCQHTVASLRHHTPSGVDELIESLIAWTENVISAPSWVRLECILAADGPRGNRADRRFEQFQTTVTTLLAGVSAHTPSSPTVTLVCTALFGLLTRHAYVHAVSRAEIEDPIRFLVRYAVS
ncbi:TetR/AcrR family transcriptional regulator [Nocardia brasiliensis]|uniref:TetR/AcrR family transcriptional regulator n=1 Tax=Nocardia brasiliensis TaxID=37326 RepID=UPI002458DFDF|nr:TetR/AcrR family transcriptional regulator [Nocardia brasiliensis]